METASSSVTQLHQSISEPSGGKMTSSAEKLKPRRCDHGWIRPRTCWRTVENSSRLQVTADCITLETATWGKDVWSPELAQKPARIWTNRFPIPQLWGIHPCQCRAAVWPEWTGQSSHVSRRLLCQPGFHWIAQSGQLENAWKPRADMSPHWHLSSLSHSEPLIFEAVPVKWHADLYWYSLIYLPARGWS